MARRYARSLVGILVLTALVMGLGVPAGAQNIKLGNLVDLTGPTSDQGKDIAQGRTDATDYINTTWGGVNGKKIELISVEYGFQPPRAVAAYKKFVEQDKVLLVLGYGTPDTEALRPFITKDKVPYLSGSYSGHLTDPKQTPYNFPGGVDYSSQIRIFLNYVKETWKESRKAKVAFIYADNSYGRAPIEVGRAYAKEIGVDLVDEQIVPTSFTDATSQLLTMKGKDPDFAYINTNTQWVPVILKDSHKLGLKTKYFINNYGIDERTPKLAGDAAEGVMGIQDVAYWGENVPGMKTLMEVHNKLHPGETPNSPYMRGWLWVILTVEAIKRAGPNADGEAIKKAFESFKEFDTWGITPPFTYTSEDHRPTTRARIVQVKGGKVVAVREVSVDRDMKWIGK
jgi:branched-chain amino acid transport system substrate-binding protein